MAASDVAFAVLVDVAVTETSFCTLADEPVFAVTSAWLSIVASEPAPEKLIPPRPNEFVVAVDVVRPVRLHRQRAAGVDAAVELGEHGAVDVRLGGDDRAADGAEGRGVDGRVGGVRRVLPCVDSDVRRRR